MAEDELYNTRAMRSAEQLLAFIIMITARSSAVSCS
jgi:hypothetical protein